MIYTSFRNSFCKELLKFDVFNLKNVFLDHFFENQKIFCFNEKNFWIEKLPPTKFEDFLCFCFRSFSFPQKTKNKTK